MPRPESSHARQIRRLVVRRFAAIVLLVLMVIPIGASTDDEPVLGKREQAEQQLVMCLKGAYEDLLHHYFKPASLKIDSCIKYLGKDLGSDQLYRITRLSKELRSLDSVTKDNIRDLAKLEREPALSRSEMLRTKVEIGIAIEAIQRYDYKRASQVLEQAGSLCPGTTRLGIAVRDLIVAIAHTTETAGRLEVAAVEFTAATIDGLEKKD